MKLVAMTALLCAAAPEALAQAAAAQPSAPATPAQIAAPSADSAAVGVIAYPPEFFAESRPNNAFDMVNRLPGFILQQVDTNVRGFAGAAGNVLIDGTRPASKTDALSDVLSRIPAAQVARIELIRGGAPGIDMGGQPVVVNVIRKTGDSGQQLLSVSSQTFLGTGKTIPGFRYEFTRQAGPRTYEFAFGSGINLDDSIGPGERVRRDAAGVVTRERLETDAGGYVPNAKATIKTPLLGGELRSGLTLQRSIFADEDNFFTDDSALLIDGESQNDSVELSANFDRDLGARWELETVALQKLARNEFVSTSSRPGNLNVFTSDADTGESIGRVLLRHRRSDTLSFEGGGEVAFNFREGKVSSTVNGVGGDLPSDDVRVEERRGEAFLQTTWRPFSTVSVEAGSRFESSTISQTGDTEQERSFFYPKPRLLLSWSPNESDQLRLRVEREISQLNFGDFVSSSNLAEERIAAGNPNLEPSKTWVAELTAERRFWGTGALVVELRRSQITDAIDRTPIFVDNDGNGTIDDVFDAPGNIGDGTNTELEVNLTLPLQRLGWTGAELKVEATLRDSEVTDPTTGELRRISGQRPDVYEVELRQDLPQYNLTLNAVYFAGWEETYFRFNEVAELEIRHYAAVFGEYKPTPQWSIRGELANLSAFEFHRDRRVFSGPRDVSPLLFTEEVFTKSQTRLTLRVRRTWGA